MGILTKRVIFFSLITLFSIYTIIVATSGTAHDPGSDHYNDQARAGKSHFQKYNCTSCHQLYGLGGYMGPDLTNTVSQKGKDKSYLTAILKTGTAKMPNFNLDDKEIEELIAFLNYIDKTGQSPLQEFKVNYDGTVDAGKTK